MIFVCAYIYTYKCAHKCDKYKYVVLISAPLRVTNVMKCLTLKKPSLKDRTC